jgi:hypothetical protein
MAGQFDVARSSLGEVKGFISSIQKITRQTKLLSLNATIEAEVAKSLNELRCLLGDADKISARLKFAMATLHIIKDYKGKEETR